jgi:hypothetical protein
MESEEEDQLNTVNYKLEIEDEDSLQDSLQDSLREETQYDENNELKRNMANQPKHSKDKNGSGSNGTGSNKS